MKWAPKYIDLMKLQMDIPSMQPFKHYREGVLLPLLRCTKADEAKGSPPNNPTSIGVVEIT
jgi:hypothetical protein